MDILETKQFRLREIEEGDAEAMYALNLDPEVVRYTGDVAFETVEATRNFIKNYPDYQQNGYGRWLVVRKTDCEVLGWCGLKFHPDSGETDLGYRFFKKYWGQGVGTETARACLAYGFEFLKLPRIVANAMTANPASVQVMKKIGMTFRNNEPCGCEPGVCYEMTIESYQKMADKFRHSYTTVFTEQVGTKDC